MTAGLRVLVALVFFFLLLRRQGLAVESSLFGSLAFGLGGFLLLWLNWPLANSPALLPLVLYALVVTADRGARRDFLLLVAAVFSLLAGGHPETILYVAIVGGLFALSRLLRRPPPERAGLAVRWALAGAIACGLAAPALVPAARLIPQSLRRHRVEVRNERMAADPSAFPGWEMRKEQREQTSGIEKRAGVGLRAERLGQQPLRFLLGGRQQQRGRLGFRRRAPRCSPPCSPSFPPRGGSGRSGSSWRWRPSEPADRGAPPRRDPPRSSSCRCSTSRSPPTGGCSWSSRFSLAYLGACTVERWRSGEGPRRGPPSSPAARRPPRARSPGGISSRPRWRRCAPCAGSGWDCSSRRWRARRGCCWCGNGAWAIWTLAALVALELLVIPPAGESVAAAERLLPDVARGPFPPGERRRLAHRGAGQPAAAQRLRGLRPGGHPDLESPEALPLRAGGGPGQRLDPHHGAHPDETGAPPLPAPRGALAGGAAADAIDPRPAAGLPRSHGADLRADPGAPPALPPRRRRERRHPGRAGMARVARCEPRLRRPRTGRADPGPAGGLDGRPARRSRPSGSSSSSPPASPPGGTSPRSASSPPASTRTAAGACCSTAACTRPWWRTARSSPPGCRSVTTGLDLVYRAPGFLPGLALAALALTGLAAWFLIPILAKPA